MSSLRSLSDAALVERLPSLVQAERHAMADLIEHLVEVQRRRLYLTSAATLYRYCIKVLGYDEHAALKRHRVANLALRLPQVLDELRAGNIHLTGLFLLSTYLRDDNADQLLREARRKSRRQLEELIARWFPRPDVPPGLEPVASSRPTCSGAGEIGYTRLEPLSPTRLRVELTARAEMYEKVEKAQLIEPLGAEWRSRRAARTGTRCVARAGDP